MDAKQALVKQARQMKKKLDDHNIRNAIVSQMDDGITFSLFTSFQRLPSLRSYIVISHGLVPGQSCNIVMTSVLSRSFESGENIAALAAFLQQLSLTMSPFHFLFDFDSRQVLIRQSSLCSNDAQPDPDLFISFVSLIAPKLDRAMARLESEPVSESDARLMADFLSENCYEEMV